MTGRFLSGLFDCCLLPFPKIARKTLPQPPLPPTGPYAATTQMLIIYDGIQNKNLPADLLGLYGGPLHPHQLLLLQKADRRQHPSR